MLSLGRFVFASFAFVATVQAWKKPNIVFILTDDQDVHMNSLDYMPLLHKYLINEGTLYDKHYCTVSVCCPSRVNLWTGLAAHNSNVTDLFPPYGGYPKFVREGLNENWLPVWLQQLGYNTYYTGKLFNAHNVDNYASPPVNGFNGSDFLLDPYTYEYLNAYMTRNNQPPVSYEGQYSPDIVKQKALDFLDEATLHDEPFFLGVAPVAPHSNVKQYPTVEMGPPKYAERHAHLFEDYKIPRTANFNPDQISGIAWMRDLPQLNDTVIDWHDEFQRSRLRALQSVDEMVESVVKSLEQKGLLENTYIFYTTDNGYHISQHRLPPGKECPFESDINIPLVVRGPAIPAGHTAGVISSHTDLTPTILKLAGGSSERLDGWPIPLNGLQLAAPDSGEHVNVEFWGRAIPESIYSKLGDDCLDLGADFTLCNAARNNTYKALRIVGSGYNILYSVWCTNEKMYFDLNRDPDQVHNYLHPENKIDTRVYTLGGRPFENVIHRLDSLLMVLKSCKARECHEPWFKLHPQGDVKNLFDALHKSYDAFYEDQPRVSYSSCELGYLLDAEGPQHANAFGEDKRKFAPVADETDGRQRTFQYHGPLEWWT